MRKDFRFGGSGGQGVISLAVLLANGLRPVMESALGNAFSKGAKSKPVKVVAGK